MRIRVTPLFVLGLLALALSVGGCGQKGPLYLPDAKPTPAPAPATAAAQGSAEAAPPVGSPAAVDAPRAPR